ncbi:hypothetical protein GCM10008922_29400 [Faecalicatena contorta]|nr:MULTISPECIES: hypothetical protein [Clostridia]MDU7708419.1 hypothetical protein [Clostridium sp.]MEE0202702.1 hypothetical protein [Muricomes sp.]GKH32812.1 hypothetical protein CE91St64_22190 [Faecalicatena contorta]
MKKVIGFALLWFAIGMFVMLALPNAIGLLVTFICLAAGYKLFCG